MTDQISNLKLKFLDALISTSLIAIFFGLPIFFAGITFQGMAFEKEIYFYFWILTALVSWMAKGIMQGEMKIRKSPLDIPIVIFWIIYLFSAIFSIDRWHSFFGFFGDPSRGFLNITALVFSYFLILSHFNIRRFKWILGSLVFSNLIASSWFLFASFGAGIVPEKTYEIIPISLIGSVSGLGIFSGLMLPILFSIVLKLSYQKGVLNMFLIGAVLVLILLNLLLLYSIYSYVSWLVILSGVGLFLAYVLSRIVKSANFNWVPLGVFGAVLVFILVGKIDLIQKINLPVEVGPGAGLSWHIAKESLKEKLFLGAGPGMYGYSFSLHYPEDFNLNYLYGLRFNAASGILFESISTIGILGTLSFVLLVLTFISVGLYLLATGRERNKIFSLGFFASSVTVLAASFSPVRIDGSILILGALMGALTVAIILNESDVDSKNMEFSLKASPKYALSFAFIVMVVVSGFISLFVLLGKAFLADAYAGKLVYESGRPRAELVQELAKAISLNGKEGRYYSRLAQEYSALANGKALENKKEDAPEISSHLENSAKAALAGKNLMPKDSVANQVLAQVYENTGLYIQDSLKLALENYQNSLALEPNNPDLYLKLGQLKLSLAVQEKGENENEKKALIEEARNFFQQAIEKKGNFASGFNHLSISQEALGDLNGAVSSMEQAMNLDSGNISYAFNLGRLYSARGSGNDYENAEKIFKKLIESSPDDANIHFELGSLYKKTNRKEESLAEYRKTLNLIPEDSGGNREKIKKNIDDLENNV